MDIHDFFRKKPKESIPRAAQESNIGKVEDKEGKEKKEETKQKKQQRVITPEDFFSHGGGGGDGGGGGVASRIVYASFE